LGSHQTTELLHKYKAIEWFVWKVHSLITNEQIELLRSYKQYFKATSGKKDERGLFEAAVAMQRC